MLIVFCTERLQRIFYLGFFDLYPARVLFILMIIFVNFERFNKFASKDVIKFFKIISIYLFLVLISALFSNDIVYSIKKWFDTFSVFMFIFLVYNFLIITFANKSAEFTKQYFLKNLKPIIILTVIGAIFLIRQIDDGGTLRTIFGINIERRISLFIDANFFCTFLIVVFSIIYFSKIKSRKFYLVFVILGIISTGSKGGMISLFIAFLLYYRYKFPIIRNRFFAISLLSIIFGFVIFAVVNPKETINKIADSSVFSSERGDGNIIPRILAWNSGFKKFVQSPILGVGPGNIVKISKGSTNEELLNFVERAGFYGLKNDAIDKIATHSTYLEILFEHGIVAFVFYILFIIQLFKISQKSLYLNKSFFLGFHIAFVSFFLSIILLSYYPYYISFLIGLFIYLYDKVKKENSLKEDSNPLR